jgi:hypothetical protein
MSEREEIQTAISRLNEARKVLSLIPLNYSDGYSPGGYDSEVLEPVEMREAV